MRAQIIRSRTGVSYTKSLLDKGQARVAKTFGEGAVELVIAAVEGEIHLLVLLESIGVPLEDVLAELERRTLRSGHEEKAARGKV